jgi:hypothetical protein
MDTTRIDSLFYFQQSVQDQIEDLTRRKVGAGYQTALLLDAILQDRYDELKIVQDQIQEWRSEYVTTFLLWRDSLERQGQALHLHPPLRYGPRLPSGRLLYKDGENWIFRRDEKGLYSSHAFWLKHLGLLLEGKEPLDVEDPEWRVVEGADELLDLETVYLKTEDASLLERIRELRAKHVYR